MCCYATKILDAKYELIDVADVMDKLSHLNLHQKVDLLKVLYDNSKMLDGTFVTYPLYMVHIELVPDAKPVHS